MGFMYVVGMYSMYGKPMAGLTTNTPKDTYKRHNTHAIGNLPVYPFFDRFGEGKTDFLQFIS